MPESFRLFIALSIQAQPPLVAVIEHLRSLGLKVVHARQLHLTLKFLGETNPQRVPEIIRALDEEAAARTPIQTSLIGLGAFPNIRRPAVIWCGLAPTAPLIEMADSLEQRLEGLGFPREQKAFKPHVTLARVKRRPDRQLTSLIDEFQQQHFGNQTLDQLTLYRSELTRTGPRYTLQHESKFIP